MLSTGSSEHGFTLIELLVAMIVALIAITIFVSMITQAFVRGSDSDAHSLASARINEVLDRLGDDLRATRKIERANIFQTATKDELRVQLGDDPVLYGDVAFASGNRLSLYTNGDGAAGPLCATWSYQQVDDGNLANVWALTRRLDSNCSPAANQGREVIATLPQGAALPTNTFRYGVLGTADNTGVCPVNTASPGGATLNAAARLRIVNVHVNLATGAGRRNVRSRERVGRDAIGLWSRLNNDYYFALGCAQ